jgi:hypothetical protein
MVFDRESFGPNADRGRLPSSVLGEACLKMWRDCYADRGGAARSCSELTSVCIEGRHCEDGEDKRAPRIRESVQAHLSVQRHCFLNRHVSCRLNIAPAWSKLIRMSAPSGAQSGGYTKTISVLVAHKTQARPEFPDCNRRFLTDQLQFVGRSSLCVAADFQEDPPTPIAIKRRRV